MTFAHRCGACGGEAVQVVEWVYPNTEQDGRVAIAGGDPYTDGRTPELCWCDDCDSHVPLYIEEREERGTT